MNRSSSFRLLTIRGVDLRVHFSLIFLLFYVVFIAAIQFPLIASQVGFEPTDLTLGPWGSGLFFALGLLVSVAIHEFGHVFVAQAQGVPVHGVTLMMLGGVSEIGQVSNKPFAEFKLAIVGPLVSFVLGFGLWSLYQVAGNPNLIFFAYWLGTANVVLGVFNLLPAFPLDGGRAFRSFLAARMGHVKATRFAVRTSEVFAWALGIFGLLGFNLLLILIAFFIYSAAQAEWMILVTRGVLRGLKVREAMTPTEVLLSGTTLSEAAQRMLKTREKVLPMTLENHAVGLVSLDAIRKLPRNRWSQVSLKDVSVKAPRELQLNESVGEVLPEILSAPFHVLPISNGSTTIGILKYSDLAEIVQFRLLERSGREEEIQDEDIAA